MGPGSDGKFCIMSATIRSGRPIRSEAHFWGVTPAPPHETNSLPCQSGGTYDDAAAGVSTSESP